MLHNFLAPVGAADVRCREAKAWKGPAKEPRSREEQSTPCLLIGCFNRGRY